MLDDEACLGKFLVSAVALKFNTVRGMLLLHKVPTIAHLLHPASERRVILRSPWV